MRTQIANYIRAGYSGLFITSYEESRVEHELKAVSKSIGYSLYAWSVTEGITDIFSGDGMPETQDPTIALGKFIDHKVEKNGDITGTSIPNKSILLLRDFHLFLSEPNPLILRSLKDALDYGKASNRTIVLLGCQLKMQPELEKELTVIPFQLPDRDQLRVVLENIAKSGDVELNGNTDAILDAASGLTTTEAENAFALSIVEAKDITPEVVYREKSATVKKNGLLEIIDSKTSMQDIGGLEVLKRDLHEKRNLFTKDAEEYGLDTPRGLLIVGQPGTGKSLCAEATRSVFSIPLLRLEAGRIFGSLVGESERNWRTAFATVKAIAPCILWIDEVDGLFSGGESSGRTDGGTTQRVIKAILQDMQFNGGGVFFVFTANDVDNLPDPLIDRLDVWSVDLPNSTERESVWSIHIAKRGRKPGKFDLGELSRLTEGFSGRQIEQVWLKALTLAFNDKGREPAAKDIQTACARVTPTSVTMAEAIKRRRERLQNRATCASEPEGRATEKVRKISK